MIGIEREKRVDASADPVHGRVRGARDGEFRVILYRFIFLNMDSSERREQTALVGLLLGTSGGLGATTEAL